MRAGVLLLACLPVASAACKPVPEVDWTCDYDVIVARPLAEQDATLEDAGTLPASVCGDTCGSPVQSCTFVRLDGGAPGAVCPFCTF
jgi:hypothetical protein